MVPRTMYACKPHWFSIPKPLRAELMLAYKKHGVISVEYVDAADACDAFLRESVVA